MSFGNPVEFTRNLLNGDRQRVGNRVKRESFTLDADHCDHALNAPVEIVLAQPPADYHWRFDHIHYSYSGAPAAGNLQATDGATLYQIDITAAGPGHLTFDAAHWQDGAQVTITLAAGGQGVMGCLNVLGVRYEKMLGDF